MGRDQVFDNSKDHKAYCLLLYHAPLSDAAKKRLTAVKDNNDGFIWPKRFGMARHGRPLWVAAIGFGDFYAFDLFFHNELLMAANHLADQIVSQGLWQEEKYQLLLALYQKDRALELVQAG